MRMSKWRSTPIIMRHKTLWILYIVICVFIVWGWFNPGGIQAALANNLWSNEFVRVYFADEAQSGKLSAPPATHPHAGIFMVKQALKANDLDSALKYITPMLDSTDKMIHEIYAMIMYEKGNYTEAFAAWEEIGDEASLWQAAWAMSEIGRNDLGTKAAASLYNLNPEQYASFYAGFFRENSDYAAEIMVFEQAISNFPNSDFLPQWQERLSDTYNKQGEIHLQQKQWELAEKSFLLAITIREDNWKPYSGLGWVYYYRDNDAEKAISFFNKVIELAPEVTDGFRNIVDVYVREGEIPQALTWLERAMAHFPDRENFFMTYAGLLRDNGEVEKALVTYKVIIARFPANGWFFYEMAWAFLRNGQPEEALQAAQQAIALNPELSAFHSLAGQIFVKLSRFEEARDAYRRALELDPNNGWAGAALKELEGSD